MFYRILKIILAVKRFFLIFAKLVLLVMFLAGAGVIWGAAPSYPVKIFLTLVFLAIWILLAPKIFSFYARLFDFAEKQLKDNKLTG